MSSKNLTRTVAKVEFGKTQLVFILIAFSALLASHYQFIANGGVSVAVGLAKISLLASFITLTINLYSVIVNGVSARSWLLTKINILVAIATLFTTIHILTDVQHSLVVAGGATISMVIALLIASVLKKQNSQTNAKSGANVKTGGGYKRKAPTITRQFKQINSDAQVGLHRRYEDLIVPQVNWTNFIGNQKLMLEVREATHAIVKPWAQRESHEVVPEDITNGILLTGGPGNGKTFIAEIIAGHYKLPLFVMTKDIVTSQWTGETTKAIAASFQLAIANTPCVLFIDEIDSFITRRGQNSGNAADNEVHGIVNSFLTALTRARDAGVIVVAATNHFDSLDDAAVREGRFDYKITVEDPDEAARIGLLREGLKKYVPLANVNWEQVDKCAKRFNGFNAKRILSISERVKVQLEKSGKNTVAHEEIMAALRSIQGTKGRIPEYALALDEIILRSDTKVLVENLIDDLKSVEVLEEYDGNIAKGILFYGPPGTGKTTVAKTIAKESGWGFLSTTGPELVADPRKLRDIYSKGKSLRPCIIFIDEADPILCDRTCSPYADVTNTLLTIMDGVDDPVKDVIFVAATNHPEKIDQALLRAPRFTGKIVFSLPGVKELTQLSAVWLNKRADKVCLDEDAELDAIMSTADISPANMEGLLQEALNNAIRCRHFVNGRVAIRALDLEHALNYTKA